MDVAIAPKGSLLAVRWWVGGGGEAIMCYVICTHALIRKLCAIMIHLMITVIMQN